MEKNKEKPREITKRCSTKYWFKCETCNHSFKISPDKISCGRWCPYCSTPPKKLCNNEDCVMCRNKSALMLKPKYLECWSSENTKIPRQVFLNASNKYKFDCKICGHQFETKLDNLNGKDRWCPYCSHRILCKNQTCKFCLSNSFQSHEKSKYWSVKNEKSPREVFISANDSFIFDCSKCKGEFTANPNSITRGRWCPNCHNKTEQILYEILKFNYNIDRQYTITTCVNKRKLPFDFYIESERCIIELDGRQHFTQVQNWDSPNDNLIKDTYKQLHCIKNNIRIIRINQEDIYHGKFDQDRLINKINNLNKSIQYMSNDKHIYIKHKRLFDYVFDNEMEFNQLHYDDFSNKCKLILFDE